jgi:hypothetical protein
MKHEDKINYMRIAAGIVGYTFDPKGLDMMVSLYDLVLEKQGDTDLKIICKVEDDVKSRDDLRRKQELLDKVSNKV